MTPRCVRAYCRVSSDAQEQEGHSLDEQRSIFEDYCRERGWPKPKLYVEVESAAEEKRGLRVKLTKLIEEAQPGDQVLVTVTDRWSRDVVFGVDSVRKLTRAGIGWIAVVEHIDATTEHGMEELLSRSVDAEKDKNRIRRRLVGGRRRLRKLGLHVEGLAPLGYKTKKKSALIVDPTTAPVIVRMFALCISGRSTRAIAAQLRTECPGVKGLDFPAVARRLRDRRYLGESNTVSARKPVGEWKQTHEAIVDAATFDAAQDALAANRVGGRPLLGDARTAAFLLRGLLRCAHCGGRMTAHSPEPGSSVRHGGYYVCSKKRADCPRGPNVKYRAADALVERQALARFAALSAELAKPAHAVRERRDPAVDERTRLTKRLANLVEAVADGTMTRDDAKAKIAETKAKLAALDRKPAPTVDRAALLARVVDAREAWGDASMAERRDALRSICVGIYARNTATKKWQRNAVEVEIEWKKFDR